MAVVTTGYRDFVRSIWAHAYSDRGSQIAHTFPMLVAEFAEMVDAVMDDAHARVADEAGDVLWACHALALALDLPEPDPVSVIIAARDNGTVPPMSVIPVLASYVQKTVQRGLHKMPVGEKTKVASTALSMVAASALASYSAAMVALGNSTEPDPFYHDEGVLADLSLLQESNIRKLLARYSSGYSVDEDINRQD